MTMSRVLLPFLFAVSLGGAANVDDIDRLYQSDAIVTGTGEVNRQIGFRACLSEVLVKLSGDPTILDAPGFAVLEAEAGSFVSSFSYRDRLEGVPIHDEQGTHDRPHDLTCRYEPATLDPLPTAAEYWTPYVVGGPTPPHTWALPFGWWRVVDGVPTPSTCSPLLLLASVNLGIGEGGDQFGTRSIMRGIFGDNPTFTVSPTA